MEKTLKKKTLNAKEVEGIYGLCRGTLGNLRWKKVGPRYFKVGKRKVLYRVADIENWVFKEVVETRDSLGSMGK